MVGVEICPPLGSGSTPMPYICLLFNKDYIVTSISITSCGITNKLATFINVSSVVDIQSG